ncbi:MAG TPA: hypothetical protein VF068_13070 [Rubrobacter sp.]
MLGLQILINRYYERHVYDLVVEEDLAIARDAATSLAVVREKERYASTRAEVMRGRATPCARAWADIWRPSLSDFVQFA